MLVWEKFKQKEDHSLSHVILFFDISCVCSIAVHFSIVIFLFGPFERAVQIPRPPCFIATHTSPEQAHRLTQACKARNPPFSSTFTESTLHSGFIGSAGNFSEPGSNPKLEIVLSWLWCGTIPLPFPVFCSIDVFEQLRWGFLMFPYG